MTTKQKNIFLVSATLVCLVLLGVTHFADPKRTSGAEPTFDKANAADTFDGISLVMGLSHVLEIPFVVGQIQLGNPALALARAVEGEPKGRVLLLPQAPGTTSLTVREKDGTQVKDLLIKVAAGAPQTVEQYIDREIASQPAARRMDLIVGIGKTITFKDQIGSIWLTDPSLFGFRRVVESEAARSVLFLPTRAGTTDLTVHKDDNSLVLAKYYVRVLPAGDREAISRQQAEESSRGLHVETLRLRVGQILNVPTPTHDGPIHLTTSSLLNYERKVEAGGAHSLMLSGLAPGITDLTTHDANGEVLIRYYVEVEK